ncbi:PQQ-dependent sugar dehydrogenase [Arenimonas sp.]|uniref:PQQ-dependent sugar dehydrogenase n=1 Tax=Arenimonas sp. TaxID=1872635 RepID=UPI0039E38A7B
MKHGLNAFAIFLLVGCSAGDPQAADAGLHPGKRDSGIERYASEHGKVSVETIAHGLEHPWGLAFLPDGRMLVTERPGRLRIVGADGEVSAPLTGLPDIADAGQGGLLDVALDPAFATNRLVYLSFSEPGEGGAGTSVFRGRLGERGLESGEIVFRQEPKLEGAKHFGSRLVFDRAGHLYITVGDRMNWPNVQRLDRGQGKIFRIWPDGRIPDDNPFVGQNDVNPAIWSFGHRNSQGAALNPFSGELWQTEHGARGGDELNIPRAGRNYGWPIITLGVNYNGDPIGSGKSEMPGMEQPIHYWTPSIAPSGLAFYTSDRFPAWKGNLFVGALAHHKLVRLSIDGDRVVGQEILLEDMGRRIRDVRQGPDGYLYLLTDEDDGRVLKVGLAP